MIGYWTAAMAAFFILWYGVKDRNSTMSGTGLMSTYRQQDVAFAKGEAALWALADWLRPFAGLPGPVAPVPAVRLNGLFRHVPLHRSPWRNVRQDSRRGPPSAVVLPC